MAVYAVGDVQGCFDPLQKLLDRIGFDQSSDTLWLTGDLVNRGPDSLKVVRFVHDLGDSAVSVLGNHDLHLLALAAGNTPGPTSGEDTLQQILTADDRHHLVDWLRRRPLLHNDPDLGYTLIHAGLPPQWRIDDAIGYAREVESVLRGPDCDSLLAGMYGDEPDLWFDGLTGLQRLRFILNCMTRLRYCDDSGRVLLKPTGHPSEQPAGVVPWFRIGHRASSGCRIVFGHWSTLGAVREKDVIALDSGCVWGGTLTALRLDAESEFVSVACGC